MKKYLLIALLLISFLWINVKADEETEEIITTDPEVAVIEEEKKEEIPTRVEMKAEPMRGDDEADDEEPSVAKVTVNIVDTRNNSVVKSFSSLATDSSMAALKIKEVFPNINNSFKDVLNGKTYTFKGFYTNAENGVLINQDFKPGDNYPALNTLRHFKPTDFGNGKLQIKAKPSITADATYDIYALWDAEKEPHTLTVNFYDVKPNGTTIVRTLSQKVEPGVAWGKTQTLDQIFVEGDTTRPYSGVYDENSTTETDETHTYTFKGWYDAETNGNVVSLTGDYAKALKELSVSGNNAISFETTSGLDDDYTINFYAYWDCVETSYLEIQNVNEVSNEGNTGWSNSNGMTSEYTHTYKDPTDGPTTHKFEYWKVYEVDAETGEEKEYDGIEYCENCNNSEFAFNFEGEPGSLTTLVGRAWWQANVTVKLYDDNKKLISEKSSFESVTVDELDDRDYEDFIGWVDANGNEVTERVFYSNEIGINPEAVEVTLYAKYKLVRKDIEITKVWADEDNENKRPSSVTITLKANEEEIKNVELNEDNEWTYTFEKLPIYNEDEETIEYTVVENNVPEGYEVSYEETETGFIIHNVLGQGDGELDNPQTGSNIILYLITLLISIIGLIGGKLCLRENN